MLSMTWLFDRVRSVNPSRFEEIKDSLRERYQVEKSVAVLAEEFGVSQQSILNYLRKMGAYEGKRKTFAGSAFKRCGQEAQSLWLQGFSASEIGRRLSVTPGIVESWAEKNSWKREEIIDLRRNRPIQLDNHFDDIVRMYTKEDKTVEEISIELGFPKGSISGWLYKNKIKKRVNYTDYIDRLVVDYDKGQGLSLAALSRKYGILSEVISVWLRQAGVSILGTPQRADVVSVSRESNFIEGVWFQGPNEKEFLQKCIDLDMMIRRYDRDVDGVIKYLTKNRREGEYGPDFVIVLQSEEVPVEIKGGVDPDDQRRWDEFRHYKGKFIVIKLNHLIKFLQVTSVEEAQNFLIDLLTEQN